jgi:hypothetical protein
VVEAWILYVISGLLGGLTSGLLWAKTWEDLKSFTFVRSLILGGVGGYVFFLMHSEWYLPNSVVAFVFGYSFQDIVEALVEKVKLLFIKK